MAVDYARVLKEMYPTVKWKGSGATYSRIVWVDTPIPQAQLLLDMPTVEFKVESLKTQSRLIKGYKSKAAKGFLSTALGSPHWYPADMENQVDLVGAVTVSSLDTSSTFPFPCLDLATTPPTEGIKLHTDSQIQRVMLDGAAYKVCLFQALDSQLKTIPTSTIAQLKLLSYVAP